MEAARWLIVFVAFVTAIGGLLVDYFIPASGRQHIKNPKCPPTRNFTTPRPSLWGFIWACWQSRFFLCINH